MNEFVTDNDVSFNNLSGEENNIFFGCNLSDLQKKYSASNVSSIEDLKKLLDKDDKYEKIDGEIYNKFRKN